MLYFISRHSAWYLHNGASNLEGLVGYRALHGESQVPVKAYGCVFGRVHQASVCIATYGMSVPSLHTESTDSVIGEATSSPIPKHLPTPLIDDTKKAKNRVLKIEGSLQVHIAT